MQAARSGYPAERKKLGNVRGTGVDVRYKVKWDLLVGVFLCGLGLGARR